MTAIIHYLNWDREDERFGPADELQHGVRHEDELPTPDDVSEHYRELDMEIDLEDVSVEEQLNAIWAALNRGSPGGYARELDELEERSLSTGDVVDLDGDRYAVKPFGWGELE